WAPQALPWLRDQLTTLADDRGDEALGDLLVAFQADPNVRRLISDLLDPTADTADGARAFLLNLLPLLATQPPEASWMQAIQSALTNAALRTAALNAARANPRPEFGPTLARLAEDASLPAAERLLAARAAPGRRELSEGVFALALGALDAKASAIDRLGAVDLLSHARLSEEQLPRLLAALHRGGAGVPDTLLPTLTRDPNDRTRPMLADFFRARLQSGWAPGRATFDLAFDSFAQDSRVRPSLIAAWERNNAQALSRLNEFRVLLNGGDAERGRELFATATCAGCHRIGAQGGVVGPDLSKIGAIRSGGDLLES